MKTNLARAALVVGGLLILAAALPAFAAGTANEIVVVTGSAAKTGGANTSHSETSIGGGVGVGALNMDNKASLLPGSAHNSALPVGGCTSLNGVWKAPAGTNAKSCGNGKSDANMKASSAYEHEPGVGKN